MQAYDEKENHGVWGGIDFSGQGNMNKGASIVKYCRKKLHVLPNGKGRCKICIRIRSQEYNKTPSGQAKRKKQNAKKHKNVLGGKCSSGKHTLTKENTQLRSNDKALMCKDCLRSLSRIRFKTHTGERSANRNYRS